MPTRIHYASRLAMHTSEQTMEHLRRQTGTHSASRAAELLIDWVLGDPSRLAEFRQYALEQPKFAK